MSWGIIDTIVLISGTSVLLVLGWMVIGLEKQINELRRRMEDR